MAGNDGVIDLLVIGGGTAGIVGSTTAAGLGARTVLVERGRTGGDCLWTGCVPSKTLLAAAARAAAGRRLTGKAPDFAAVREDIARAIETIRPEDSPEALEAAGVAVRRGSARFTGPGMAEVDGEQLRFRQALIATGSAPAVPGIPGLDRAQVVTSETIWDLDTLPGRMVFIGAGPVACELGQAFARLGADVVIVDRSRMLDQEDRESAALVRQSLEADGVRFVENTGIERVDTAGGVSTVWLDGGRQLEAEVIVAATGRAPRTQELGLDSVGVDCDDAGHVVVDDRMRTSGPGIWAAGDVTPGPEFTHLAGVQGSVAASNAVLGPLRKTDSTVPRVTYTSPELAAVGITEPAGPGQTVLSVPHRQLDRAVTDNDTAGLTRLIVDKRGRILGGTIVAPRAGEALAELTLAVRQGLHTSDLTGTTHPYPAYTDGLWKAAIAHTQARLRSPAAVFAIKVLYCVNKWRADRRQGRSGQR